MKAAETVINFTALSMQINFNNIISFKVASYSACSLLNGDSIRYLLENAWQKSDSGGEEVEMFSALIEIVEAAL